jgi:hypothetical protein
VLDNDPTRSLARAALFFSGDIWRTQTDLTRLVKDELKRLAYELGTFVKKAAGVGYTEAGMGKAERRLRSLQLGLRARLSDLAEMKPVRFVDRDGIKDSRYSSTFVPSEGSTELAAIEGDPYRQFVQSHKVEAQVYAALASHIVASGIVGGQIRTCPECERLFMLKIKPQPNRDFHCSTPCTNRATFRRFSQKKRSEQRLAIARQLAEVAKKDLVLALSRSQGRKRKSIDKARRADDSQPPCSRC